MKKIIFCLLTIFLVACSEPIPEWKVKGFASYNEYVMDDLSKLKSPVILVAIGKSMVGCNITVKDSCGTIRGYGNTSFIANNIGNSLNVGDTIK